MQSQLRLVAWSCKDEIIDLAVSPRGENREARLKPTLSSIDHGSSLSLIQHAQNQRLQQAEGITLWYPRILPKEEPQYRPRNNLPIMLETRRLLGLTDVLLIRYRPLLDPHIHLVPHHILIERHVSLRSEQSVLDVQSLYGRVSTAPPDVHLRVRRQQALGALYGRYRGDVVLVHLMEGDVIFLRPEQLPPDVRQVDPAVC